LNPLPPALSEQLIHARDRSQPASTYRPQPATPCEKSGLNPHLASGFEKSGLRADLGSITLKSGVSLVELMSLSRRHTSDTVRMSGSIRLVLDGQDALVRGLVLLTITGEGCPSGRIGAQAPADT
jgi:hypothetical protein